MNEYRIRQPALAPQGRERIAFAESRMPVTMMLRERHRTTKPLAGQRIAYCAPVTKESAVLVRTLAAAGAELSWAEGNYITAHDDVAAAAVSEGVRVFAWSGMSADEGRWALQQALLSLAPGPTLVADTGADLIALLHTHHPEMARHVRGGNDKTTDVVKRLRGMAAAGELKFPVIDSNDVVTKWEFDNMYGTGQSTIDGILRATCLMLAGRTFVVAGYGHVGRGVALRARGMGCQVIVTCRRATTALRACMEGFRVMPMAAASPLGDLFCTTTGADRVITGRHLDLMKDGAILANAGHSTTEIALDDLDERTVSTRELRPYALLPSYMTEHHLRNGRRLCLLASGGLVNLAAAEGNSGDVMDLSFANQFLACLRLVREAAHLEPRVYELGDEQDQDIARLKLHSMGVRIDILTEAQRQYAGDAASGT